MWSISLSGGDDVTSNYSRIIHAIRRTQEMKFGPKWPHTLINKEQRERETHRWKDDGGKQGFKLDVSQKNDKSWSWFHICGKERRERLGYIWTHNKRMIKITWWIVEMRKFSPVFELLVYIEHFLMEIWQIKHGFWCDFRGKAHLNDVYINTQPILWYF